PRPSRQPAAAFRRHTRLASRPRRDRPPTPRRRRRTRATAATETRFFHSRSATLPGTRPVVLPARHRSTRRPPQRRARRRPFAVEAPSFRIVLGDANRAVLLL